MCDGKVNTKRCQLYLRWERIKTCKNVSQVWVSPGSKSIKKDSLKKHSDFLWHCEAHELQSKGDLGADVYIQSVVLTSPWRKSFLRLKEADKDGLPIKFKTVYHNIKNENPYADYPGLLNLQRLNGVQVLLPSKEANSYATAEARAILALHQKVSHGWTAEQSC